MRTVLVFIFCFLLGEARGQKYDNYWVGGRYSNLQSQGAFGNSDMEFLTDSVRHAAHPRNSAYNASMFSLCTRNGNFLAHSNGFWVMDTSNQIIENGDSVNYGTGWEAFRSAAQEATGYPQIQGMHVIPVPSNDSMYYVFHSTFSYINGSFFTDSLCYSELVVRGNGSLYLRRKNVVLTNPNNMPQDGNLASCKHGNGRDWWLSYNGKNSNCIRLFLVTPDTIEYYGEHCEGDTIFSQTGRYSVFSKDGSKYARTGSGGTNIFDFDRCSGTFSNIKQIPPALTYEPSLQQNVFWIMSIDISPNNRFLYSVLTRKVIQYDLWDADPDLTRDTIGDLDYFVDTIPDAGSGYFLFAFCQSGPNGKIYIGSSNGERFLCTIHNPDGKGDSCQFGMRDVVLPKFWKASMPYYPNYRLGRLIGSACDTVYHDTTVTNMNSIYKTMPTLKLYPNPATTEVQLDYNWLEWERIANLELRITNELGQVVMSSAIPQYSSTQKINIKPLSPGVYTVALTNANQQIAVCRLTKM